MEVLSGEIQRSVAFRPTLTDGLALSENNTCLLDLENIVIESEIDFNE